MKPLVSVIMPAYNAEKWIAEAIDSILNQTYENIELLIRDDGSNDETDNIISDVCIRRNAKNVKVFHGFTNRGVTDTLNQLIMQSKGKYIARMDADDIADRERIQLQVEYLEEVDGYAPTAAVGSSVELFGDENTNELREFWWGNDIWYPELILATLPYGNCICHPSVMFRGEVLREYMYEGNGAFQDYDLFLRMASDGMRIGKCRDYLLKYRVRSDSEAAINESDWAEIKLKLRFLIKKFPRWNKFDTHVMRSIWQIIRR